MTSLELREAKYYVSKTRKWPKPKDVTEGATFPVIAIGAPLTKVKVFYDSDAEDEGCSGASHQLKVCKANNDVCKARYQLFATLFGEDHEKTVRRLNPCLALWCKQIGLLEYDFWTSRPRRVEQMIRKNLMGIDPQSRKAELNMVSNDCAFEFDPMLAQWKKDWTEWRRKKGSLQRLGNCCYSSCSGTRWLRRRSPTPAVFIGIHGAPNPGWRIAVQRIVQRARHARAGRPALRRVQQMQSVIPTGRSSRPGRPGRPVYGLVVYHLPNRVISCRYVSSWGVVEALRYHIPSGKSLSAQGRAKIILLVETEVHYVH